MMGRSIRSTTASTIIGLAVTACGRETLDLGRNDPDPDNNYATPKTIAAEADAGLGVPTVLARNQGTALAVAVDEARVYWLARVEDENAYGTEGRFYARSCVKSDCAGTRITYATSGIPESYSPRMAVNGTHVFWTGRVDWPDALLSCPIAGCAPRPVEIFTTGGAIEPVDNFVVDPDAIFLLIDEGVVRCPSTGCEGHQMLLASITGPKGMAFASDDANLYWIERPRAFPTASIIMTVPKSGATTPRVVAQAGHLVEALAFQGTNLYWSESNVSSIMKTCDPSNCEATTETLTTGESYPHYLAALGDGAAWIRCSNDAFYPSHGRVVDWPIDQSGRARIAFPTDENSPTSLALDATHVYWTTYSEHGDPGPSYPPTFYGDGAVKRARRPR